jgi:hypothetical protein
MAAGAWTPTNTTKQKIFNGQFNLDSDTVKCGLWLSTSDMSVTETTYAGITNECGTTNTGYTTGGAAITMTVTLVTTDDAMCDIDTDPYWTAGSANLTSRWTGIYEVSGDLMFFALLDSTPADVTATNGNTLTVAAAAGGVVQLT